MERTTTMRGAGLAALGAALLGATLTQANGATPAPASAPAATMANEAHAELVAGSVDWLVGWTRYEFTLTPDLDVDADVRSRLEAVFAGFAERQRPLFARWVGELIGSAAGRDNATSAVNRGLWPRIAATLADWRLRAANPAHEALLRQAASNPGNCRVLHRARTTLDEIAALMQQVPPTRRDAFIDGERQLLAQWDAAPPVRAASGEDPGRDIARWTLALRHGEPPDTLPMAPWLAGRLTAEPPQDVQRAGRCAARQWWVVSRLQQAPADGEAIWQAWHLAFARNLLDFNQGMVPYPVATGPTDYPLLPRKLGLQGSVTVRVERDARGRFRSGEVTQRQLAADTLPQRAAPMFDHLLDGASIARARQLTNEQASAAAPGASAARAGQTTFQFNWRIE